MSKYRVQVNAMATVHMKTGRTITEQGSTGAGLIIPRLVDEEQEYDCKMVAFGFGGTQIKESDLEEHLKQLMAGLKKTMRDKGLVI